MKLFSATLVLIALFFTFSANAQIEKDSLSTASFEKDKEYILGLPDNNLDLFSKGQSSYPTPTYDFFERTKYSKNLLWHWKKSSKVKSYNSKILSRHVKVQ